MARRDFARGFVMGGAVLAWIYPLAQYLTNQAAGRGMLDIKEK